MKTNKKFALLLSLSLLAATASACTGNNGNKAGESPSASQPAATTSAELVVWVGGLNTSDEIDSELKKAGNDPTKMPAQVQASYDLKTAFEKQNPGVKLKFENHGWGDDLSSNLQRAVLGGVGPDVTAGETQVADFARIGAFKAIDISNIKADLIEGTYKAAIYKGKVYGLPLKTGTFALQYNKDVLRKAGYDPDKDIPKTWDELLAISKAITEKGKGQYYGFMVQPIPGLGSMFRAHPFIKQLGADLGTDDGDVTFDGPEQQKVYEFLRNLSLTSPPGTAAVTDEGKLLAEIHSGKVAFQIDGPWQIDWAKEDKCDCGYARLPVPADGKTGNTIVGNVIYSVLQGSKHPEAAEKFVRFVASPEAQALQMKVQAILPVNKKAIDLVPNFFTRYPEMKVFWDELAGAKNLAPLPTFKKNGSKINDQWTILKSSVFDPSKDLKVEVPKVQQGAADLLK